MTAREKKKKLFLLFILAFFLLFLAISIYMMNLFNMFPQKYYLAKDFGIETIKSEVDFNKNGTDDYTDILLGARKDAENHPVYNGKYYDEGYPPDNIGVCTDVIWRAFKNAGYSLRDMIDNDIKRRPEEYKNIKTRDKNIDFRRVVNLEIFFDEYALTLTSDISEIEEWQPGDIVIFNNGKHIELSPTKGTRTANLILYITEVNRIEKRTI